MRLGRNLRPSRFSGIASLVSAMLLVAAGLLATLYEDQLYRNQQAQQTRVQAQILAASITAALAFNDRTVSQEYVDALQANPEVEAAGVYDVTGARIAGFLRVGAAEL